MKVNDLVSWNGRPVLITELYESKMWRTAENGKAVSFKDIDPEPFARIFFKGMLRGVPLTDLKPIDEAR
mgnify:CR=1 FL=1